MEFVAVVAFLFALFAPMFGMPAIIQTVGLANLTGVMAIAFVVVLYISKDAKSLAKLEDVIDMEEEGAVFVFSLLFLVGSGVGLLKPQIGFVWSAIAILAGTVTALAGWIALCEATRGANEAERRAREADRAA